MSHRRHDLDNFIEETRASQRNIAFPDTVRNGRSVDAFLWRGSPYPQPLVQRIAAWMFGAAFVCMGTVCFSMAVKERVGHGFSFGVVFLVALSICFVLVGARIFRNGFPRPSNPPPE
jgi:hypothetical protein